MKTINNLYYKLRPGSYKNGVTEYLIENNHKQNLLGVEIGVGDGRNAYCMLRNLPIEQLYLVDPYEPFYEGDTLVTNYCNFFNEANKRLLKYNDNIRFVKKFACNAINIIPNDLDFIWFDASGNYKIVKEFLVDWFPKLKPGGVLGGKRFNSNWFGLCHAVLEFVNKNGFECFGCNSGDWWIVKK